MKQLFTFFMAICINAGINGQSPEKMSYQAIIRDASDDLLSNTSIGMQISILQDSISGTVVYVETHTPTTNVNGLINLEIGDGTAVTGTFSAIDWADGPYFVKTETDPDGGSNYSISGTSQFLSVPYALHAKTASISPASFYKVNATRTLISSTSFIPVSGLSQTIVLTSNADVLLSTYGSMETTSSIYSGSGTIVQLFQDGVAITDAFQTQDVLDASFYTNLISPWRFETYLNLTPGTYTFDVRARKYGFDNFYAGGNFTAPTPNEGNMIIKVFPK